MLRVISLTALTLGSPEIAIAHTVNYAEAEDQAYLQDVVMRSSLAHLSVTTNVVTSSLGVADTISKEAHDGHADLIRHHKS